jgi:hypothetical protein
MAAILEFASRPSPRRMRISGMSLSTATQGEWHALTNLSVYVKVESDA